MELPTLCVDTSLNLNLVPSRHIDVAAEVVLVEELERLSSENKRLTETLNQMCGRYLVLQKQLSEFSHTKEEEEKASLPPSRKRKAESDDEINNWVKDHHHHHHQLFGITECTSTTAATTTNTTTEEEIFKSRSKYNTSLTVSKVHVPTDPSDTSLYVRDGYQWRKYGQKVTRDNPSPRAYFKCSYAPSCKVKKKVQRSVEDPTVLVATYEGEHNHPNHQTEITLMSATESPAASGSSFSIIPSPNNNKNGSPNVTVDELVKSRTVVDNAQKSTLPIHKFLVHQMASSLTRDPHFTAALASAISGTFLQHHSSLHNP